MDVKHLKLATYLDEADDTPESGYKVLSDLGISNIALRTMWTREVIDLPDESIADTSKQFDDNGLKVVLLHTSIGNCQGDKLLSQLDSAKRAIAIAEVLKCPHIRFSLGKSRNHAQQWLEAISVYCLGANIKPLFGLETGICFNHPAELAQLLNSHKRWGIVYDPVDIISVRAQQPFSKYWSLLKSKVSAIDVHDYKTGFGPKPLGHGNGQLDLTINDAILSNFSGWYCLEPGLGKKADKAASLKQSLETLREMLSRMAIPNIMPSNSGKAWRSNAIRTI